MATVHNCARLAAAGGMLLLWGGADADGAVQILYSAGSADGALIASQPANDGSVIVETDFGAGNQGQILLLTPRGNGQPYTATTLKVFNGNDADGGHPSGHIAIDSVGNIWGMTNASTAHSQGTIFRVSNEGGSWSFQTVFVIPDTAGLIGNPSGYGGLVFDRKDNLYGLAAMPCQDDACGTIFEVKAAALNSAENKKNAALKVLFSFNDGHTPIGMARDKDGNLFGVQTRGGEASLGSVWEVSPPAAKGAAWTGRTLYSFCVVQQNGCPDGYLPEGPPAVDSAGNLYGTTSAGGDATSFAADGTAWKMTRSGANFSFQTVHTFNDQGCNDYPDNRVTTPVARTLLKGGQILTLVLSGGVKHKCTDHEAVYAGAVVKVDTGSGSDIVENDGWGSPGFFSGITGVGSDPSMQAGVLYGTTTGYYDRLTGELRPGVVFSTVP